MKLCLSSIILLLLLTQPVFSQNSALSMHLSGKDNVSGNIITKTLKVPHKTLSTYYCALMWNVGSDGGGYCGMQNHPSGNNFIFSIWDPVTSNDPIKANFTGRGTKVENFGGEGTGLKSWNFELGWIEGNEYQFASRTWNEGGSTFFGFWVQDIESKNWTHLVTMDFPVKNINFNTTTGSFLEDWSSTGQNMRKVFQKNGYKKDLYNNWIPFNISHYSINTYDIEKGRRSYNYRNNYDAGIEDGYFYMQSGGNTSPSFSGQSKDLSLSFPSEPENSIIDFYITEASTSKLCWTVPQSSTPQFKVRIIKNGSLIVEEINPEIREYNIDAETGNIILLKIEDILGRETTKSIKIGSNEFSPKTPSALQMSKSGFSDVTIKWNSTINAENYKIQILENFVWTDAGTTTDTIYTIKNLSEGNSYRTRVSAINSFGESAYTEYLEITANSRIVSQDAWELVFVNSQEIYGEDGDAKNAFDGDQSTIWHTNWSGSNPSHPHEIQIDLKTQYDLFAFKYLPRQDGGSNGTTKDFEFYVSNDKNIWGDPVATGTFESNNQEKQIEFSTKSGRYIKLVSLSEINGGNWASAAEINVLGSIFTNIKESDIPENFILHPAYPNPFNPSTSITFEINKTRNIDIRIFNMLGENVRTIYSGEKTPGSYKMIWDGKTNSGTKCVSGIYILEITDGYKKHHNKLVLLK